MPIKFNQEEYNRIDKALKEVKADITQRSVIFSMLSVWGVEKAIQTIYEWSAMGKTGKKVERE